MATTKKKLNKAFISLGKIKGNDGKDEEEYLVISEDLAKFMGAKYSTTPPVPKKVTTKIGGQTRIVERQHSVAITGRKYELGYVQGTKAVKSGKTVTKKAVIKIKWVAIYCPYNMNTRKFINAVISKLTKKPGFLRMPSGISQPLSFTK